MPRRRNALRRGSAALLTAAALVFSGPLAATESCPVPSKQEPPPATDDSRADLQAWERETSQSLPESRRPDPRALPAILAQIQAPAPRERSLWERFVSWLESWLARNQESPSKAPNWLVEFLRAIPPYVITNIFLAILGLLVISLGVLLIIELRAAGAGKRRPREARARKAVAGVTPARARIALADIANLPLAEQPGALLQWAIGSFVDRGILPADASLTNGELAALLRARAPDTLPAFRRVTRAAESSVYGGIEPGEAETRALIESLRATAAG